jgi:hypothetical protein
MSSDFSIQFFDKQFSEHVRTGDAKLNPFEPAAISYLNGRGFKFCVMERKRASILGCYSDASAGGDKA